MERSTQSVSYKLTGKLVSGAKTIGYKLNNGEKEINVTSDVMAFLVGKGVINNCDGQLYRSDVLYRGKNGLEFKSLPIERVGNAKGDESINGEHAENKNETHRTDNKHKKLESDKPKVISETLENEFRERRLEVSNARQLYTVLKGEVMASTESKEDVGTDITFTKPGSFMASNMLVYRQFGNVQLSLMKNGAEVHHKGLNTMCDEAELNDEIERMVNEIEG